MPTGQYPFIDIAVHEKIRTRYAAGDAVVVLSLSLTDVLWVNGPGARLFGHAGLYEFMDSGLSPSTASFRQIEAAASSVVNATDNPQQTFVMRTGSGFRRPLLPAAMERIQLADGNHALLLTASIADPAETPEEQAAFIIDGFEEMDTHAAVLDRDGAILQATGSFDRLNMDAETRAQIVRDVASENDRLVKHPVRTALGFLPAAIARITDDAHLLIAIEMSIGNLDPAPGDQPKTIERAAVPAVQPVKAPDPTPSVLDLASSSRERDGGDRQRPADADSREQDLDVTEGPAEQPARQSAANDQDDRDANTAATAKASVSSPDIAHPVDDDGKTSSPDEDQFVFNPRKRPVRFVWKIDAEGVFREISDEFAETVGPNAADIEGRKFADVAQVFNTDPDHAISDLLRRRDTWSGKTVLWPVQGTDLRVPVDLAALPTYSRDREFDGFRGFGIVRASDAQSDPERIGLALVNNPATLDSIDQAPDPVGQHDESDSIDGPSHGPQPTENDETPPSGEQPHSRDGAQEEGEKPALDIADSPGRRQSDKVIRLEERRSKPRDGLSTAEKQAFHEIAKRLGQTPDQDTPEPPVAFGKRPVPPQSADDDVAPGLASEEDETGGQDEANTPVTADTPDDADAPPPAVKTETEEEPTQELLGRDASVTPELLENLPIPVIVHDGTTIFHINEEFRLLTGYLSTTQLNEAGGLDILFDGHSAIGDTVETASGAGTLALHLANGQSVSVRARLRSIAWDDGRALMLALSEVVPAASQPEADVIDGPVEDTVSEEERVESAGRISALQVEVDELRSILETATDGVVLIDDDGIIRSMNQSASALFDYDEEETSGQPFAMLFAHESQRAVQDYLAGLTGNAVASVLNDGREVIGREASGGFLPLFMTIGHLSRSNGFCAVMRDITQWKRAEEELRTAKREAETASSHKSEFLARVSHEIRTPLNAIIGFSDLMAEERFGPIGSPRYVEYAHDIGRSGKHVLDIVNDLLDISKIEAGEQELDFQAVSLNQALLDAVSILQPQANSQRVIIRTSLSSSVPDVVADQRSIKQIAINILSNAIRFTQAGGQVVVSTSYEESGNVSLRIRDTGVGMTRHQLEQAMKPFRQVTGVPRERGDGTGLGLPLAKAMAEANRAQFAMNSQPGQGTLVEIVFPSQRVLAE
ncbi:MAG: PAS domain S-box protein [Alphaproteobacteria bacterium]|nr:PAS domain S-box protein [Alphaproteobacteria bacterium]